MAGTLEVNMKNFAFFVVTVCLLQSALSSSAANTNQCPDKVNTCQCLYRAGGSGANDDIDVDTNAEDPRTVGLAAATGTLAGVLATGTAMAAYFHFRGSPGGGGGFGGGRPGGGGGDLPTHGGGDWRGGPRTMQRPDSIASSSGDSYESQSPLTKSDRREKLSGPESRGRPFTGSSTSSNATNIYRHAKVWPGRF